MGMVTMRFLKRNQVFEQCDEPADEAFYEWMKEFRSGFSEPPDLWSPATTILVADKLEKAFTEDAEWWDAMIDHQKNKLKELLEWLRKSVDGFYCG